MRNQGDWNPYYMDPASMGTQQGRMYPWLYPYGTRLNCWNLWNSPERMEDETDSRRLQELYPIMARRLQPYVEEVCTRLEYPGSMMYDEYPDRLSFFGRQNPCGKRQERRSILKNRNPSGNSCRT